MRAISHGLLVLSVIVGTPVLIGTPVTAETTQSLWKRFSSPKGKFSIVMPGTPKQRQEKGLSLFELVRDEESVRYSVSYLDLPATAGNNPKLQNEIYDGIRRGAEKGDGKLISYRTIAIKGYPGREMNFSLPDNMVARWRVYLVNKRAYFVNVTTTQENQARSLSTSIDVFLNSFQLLGK